MEQYEQLLLQKQAQFQARQAELAAARPPVTQHPQSAPAETTNASDQEIPDNVTAELEKLEQETGTMVELQGVSDILGGLGDDDDELLGSYN